MILNARDKITRCLLRRLMPVQNGPAAFNIANVCRRFLEEGQ